MDCQIVTMSWAHVPAVAELEEQCFADPWSENSISRELENPLSLWLVALHDGCVVGYIGSQTVLDQTDIMNIAVCPSLRGCGIGKALLRALEARLRTEQVSSMTLEVRPSNAPATALYAREGFSQVGRRKKYYANPPEDAWILRKEWTL